VIGRFQPGNHTNFMDQQHYDLRPTPASTDLWKRPAAECKLLNKNGHLFLNSRLSAFCLWLWRFVHAAADHITLPS
jgi:hypothetical protein